jgi:prolyl-tRNA editing enzyme YbaK/EbsC (Cys-tRNA(Pro) deacylase)
VRCNHALSLERGGVTDLIQHHAVCCMQQIRDLNCVRKLPLTVALDFSTVYISAGARDHLLLLAVRPTGVSTGTATHFSP